MKENKEQLLQALRTVEHLINYKVGLKQARIFIAACLVKDSISTRELAEITGSAAPDARTQMQQLKEKGLYKVVSNNDQVFRYVRTERAEKLYKLLDS